VLVEIEVTTEAIAMKLLIAAYCVMTQGIRSQL